MKLFARLLLVAFLFVAVGTVYNAFADNSTSLVIKKNSNDVLSGAILSDEIKLETNYKVFATVYPGDDVLNGYRQEIKPTNNSPPTTGDKVTGLQIR